MLCNNYNLADYQYINNHWLIPYSFWHACKLLLIQGFGNVNPENRNF